MSIAQLLPDLLKNLYNLWIGSEGLVFEVLIDADSNPAITDRVRGRKVCQLAVFDSNIGVVDEGCRLWGVGCNCGSLWPPSSE